MLCASLGVTSTPRPDHAHYIGSWLKALGNDKKFIFAAASAAQKAVDYLYSLQAYQASPELAEAA
jgi:antirestriction protein ArdC